AGDIGLGYLLSHGGCSIFLWCLIGLHEFYLTTTLMPDSGARRDEKQDDVAEKAIERLVVEFADGQQSGDQGNQDGQDGIGRCNGPDAVDQIGNTATNHKDDE